MKSQDQAKQLQRAVVRLRAQCANVPPDLVESVVRSAFSQLENPSTIPDYQILLAVRRANRRLQCEAHHVAPAAGALAS